MQNKNQFLKDYYDYFVLKFLIMKMNINKIIFKLITLLFVIKYFNLENGYSRCMHLKYCFIYWSNKLLDIIETIFGFGYLKTIILFLRNVLSMIDTEIEFFQIVHYSRNKKCIFENKKISDVINIISNKNNKIPPRITLNIYFNNDGNGLNENMKIDYIVRDYYDPEKICDNTLKNIMSMERILNNNDNKMNIELEAKKYYDNVLYKYCEYDNKHINDMIDIWNIQDKIN